MSVTKMILVLVPGLVNSNNDNKGRRVLPKARAPEARLLDQSAGTARVASRAPSLQWEPKSKLITKEAELGRLVTPAPRAWSPFFVFSSPSLEQFCSPPFLKDSRASQSLISRPPRP